MNITAAAAIAFAIAAAGVIGFQMALALGVPWGSYAMGGAFPGKFPPRMRVAALVQAVLLAGTVAIVLSRAGLVLPAWSGVVGWLICSRSSPPSSTLSLPVRASDASGCRSHW